MDRNIVMNRMREHLIDPQVEEIAVAIELAPVEEVVDEPEIPSE